MKKNNNPGNRAKPPQQKGSNQKPYNVNELLATEGYNPKKRPDRKDKSGSSVATGRTSLSSRSSDDQSSNKTKQPKRISLHQEYFEKKRAKIQLTKQELQVVEKEVVRLVNKKRAGLFGFSFTRKPLKIDNSICKLTKNKNNHDIKH